MRYEDARRARLARFVEQFGLDPTDELLDLIIDKIQRNKTKQGASLVPCDKIAKA